MRPATRAPWASSTRASRLPKDWAKRRAATKRRARNQCEAQVHAPGCDGTGSECDHIKPGDDHSLTNLQWLSAECHAAKTKAENTAANKARAALRLRPVEPHPGRL